MKRSLFIIICILLSCWQCNEPPQDLQRSLMENIFTDLDLYCGSSYNVTLDAGVVKFLHCKEPAPNDEGDFILRGSEISYKISFTTFTENEITKCMDESSIFEGYEYTGIVEPLSDEIPTPDYQDCLNLIERENQTITCLFNKDYISDFNGDENAFALIRIYEIIKL